MPSDQPIAELKPCPNPWCMSSKRPTFESFGPRDAHEHYFECVCGVHPAPETTYTGAIAAWNTRPAEVELATLKAQLAAAVGPGLSPAEMRVEAEALRTENERLRARCKQLEAAVEEVPAWFERWGVEIGPAEEALIDDCRAALAPVAQPSAEGTEAADGKA